MGLQRDWLHGLLEIEGGLNLKNKIISLFARRRSKSDFSREDFDAVKRLNLIMLFTAMRLAL